MTFEYRDHTGDTFRARLRTSLDGPLVALETNDSGPVLVPLTRVEEVVAGIRDAARTAARQTTGQDDTEPDPTTADDPTPLRWGLGDVLHGDDDTTIVCLSGPDREPYWLELEPEQRDALRDDLAPPGNEQLAERAEAALNAVRAVVDQASYPGPGGWPSVPVLLRKLRAALDAHTAPTEPR